MNKLQWSVWLAFAFGIGFQFEMFNRNMWSWFFGSVYIACMLTLSMMIPYFEESAGNNQKVTRDRSEKDGK